MNNFRPPYWDTDSLYSKKQQLNQIYGTQVKGAQCMGFSLQVFYEQISESCDVISTSTLNDGTIYQIFKSIDGVFIYVWLDPFKHVIKKINIYPQ